ncbi:MAG: LysM peptidoglycan-binding domain-containing protein [Anaerolineae bacterium]|nr:LysM peptidoglycan-binding domain-containing protein [Anaerolineae bacterium]
MNRRLWFIVLVLAGMGLLASACGDSDDKPAGVSPTPPDSLSPTVILAAPTQTPGGPTLTASPTLPPTITPTETPPPALPTATALPTETPGPYEHQIQPGDTCVSIAYQYGHVDLDVIALIRNLNSLREPCVLPGQGTVLIPRPTATPTEVGADLTQTAIATSAPPQATLNVGQNFAIQTYQVQEGDTLSSVAIVNDTSLRMICELNQVPDKNPNGIDCRGCVWETSNCCCPNPPVLSVNQELFVPGPTPTPTLTPTPSGDEPPTATPTHPVPQPIYPPAGASVAGAVRLLWLTVGPLVENEYYLVTVREATTAAEFSIQTRQLSAAIPLEYLPTDGQARNFEWQVTVVRLGDDGLFYPVSDWVSPRQFVWRGWE